MKKSIQRSLTLFISFLLVTAAQAQHDFKRGYIITYNNDTIHGQIDYAPMQINSVMCNFRPDSTKPVTIYSAADLKGYSFVPGKRCLSKNVTIDDVLLRYFLECLIIGDANLYYLKIKGHEYYFVERSAKMYELRNDHYTYVDEGVTYSKESEEYKKILLDVLGDVPKIPEEIHRTYFNRKSLSELLIKYHELIDKPTAYWMYTTPDAVPKRKNKKK